MNSPPTEAQLLEQQLTMFTISVCLHKRGDRAEHADKKCSYCGGLREGIYCNGYDDKTRTKLCLSTSCVSRRGGNSK